MKKIVGILVVVLLIATMVPVTGLAEENEIKIVNTTANKECNYVTIGELKKAHSIIKPDNPMAIRTHMLDQLDQQQTTINDEERIGPLSPGGALGQSFKPTLPILTRIKVWLIKSSGNLEFANYYFELRKDSVSSSSLRQFVLSSSEFPTGLIELTLIFTGGCAVTPGDEYFVVAYGASPTIYTTQLKWCYGYNDPYANGYGYYRDAVSGNWNWFYHGIAHCDFCFETYGEGTANNPPFTPSKPTGPATGNVGVSYSYSTSTIDPDGHQIMYAWDWESDGIVDDWSGLLSSGTPSTMSHSWGSAGMYQIQVKAQDEYGAESGWSSALTVTISGANNPPNKPSIPSGSNSGKAGNSYAYSSSTIDPDGDQIWYLFDWGDGNDSGWKGPHSSGDTAAESHIWKTQGTYAVKVKAKDDPNGDGDLSDGSESVWSDPLSVTMPKTKAIHPLFVRLFECFPLLAGLLNLKVSNLNLSSLFFLEPPNQP